MLIGCSVLGDNGSDLCCYTLEYHHESSDANEGEDRRGIGDEHGSPVSREKPPPPWCDHRSVLQANMPRVLRHPHLSNALRSLNSLRGISLVSSASAAQLAKATERLPTNT